MKILFNVVLVLSFLFETLASVSMIGGPEGVDRFDQVSADLESGAEVVVQLPFEAQLPLLSCDLQSAPEAVDGVVEPAEVPQ